MTHEIDADEADALLAEYRAAVQKIDATVAQLSARAADQLRCARGCAQCCAQGLSVLPVEALAIEASGLRAPAHAQAGMCAFLDEQGACSIYPARPLLCRTHGLALRSPPAARASAGLLTILEDGVSVCALNYTERAPRADEVLDAEKVLALLVTVDRRFRARAGLPDDASRVPLDELAEALRARR